MTISSVDVVSRPESGQGGGSGNETTSTEVAKLRKELRVQNQKFELLLKAKEAAEKKYKSDYKKWRSFKQWILDQSDHGKALRERLNEEKLDISIGSSPMPSSAGSRMNAFTPRTGVGLSKPTTGKTRGEGSLSDSECVQSGHTRRESLSSCSPLRAQVTSARTSRPGADGE